jgi:enamine deaminase RidA (YjgF/YER057c/UK114 family)
LIVLTPLSREDTPAGLQFSLGFSVDPGSDLIFLRSSDARPEPGPSTGFVSQTSESLRFVIDAARRAAPDAEIAKVRRYMTSGRGHRSAEAREVWQKTFPTNLPPSTALEVPGTTLYGSLIDLEAWAVAPAGLGRAPLSRVVGRGGVSDAVVVRGDQSLAVAAVRPEAAGSPIEELRRALDLAESDLSRQGAGRADVAKLTVYLRDPRSWPAIEAVVAERFGSEQPVLNGVVVANLQRPEAHIELSAWARISEDSAPSGRGVSLRERLLMLTGTAAMPVFVGGTAADAYGQTLIPDVAEQAQIAMENQRKVLEAAGATFDNVFRSNWYLTDIRDWPQIEPVVREHFGRDLPVPQIVEVSRLTAKPGIRFEPDLWATCPVAS